jgi:hypothetical protein
MKYEYKNPEYNAHGTIDCEINHSQYGWVPFTASPDDSEDHGREIYNRIIKENKNIKPYSPTVFSNDQLASMARSERDNLLVKSDWTQLLDVPENIKTLWQVYRQALRDIPQQSGFPQNIVWPVAPV